MSRLTARNMNSNHCEEDCGQGTLLLLLSLVLLFFCILALLLLAFYLLSLFRFFLLNIIGSSCEHFWHHNNSMRTEDKHKKLAHRLEELLPKPSSRTGEP